MVHVRRPQVCERHVPSRHNPTPESAAATLQVGAEAHRHTKRWSFTRFRRTRSLSARWHWNRRDPRYGMHWTATSTASWKPVTRGRAGQGMGPSYVSSQPLLITGTNRPNSWRTCFHPRTVLFIGSRGRGGSGRAVASWKRIIPFLRGGSLDSRPTAGRPPGPRHNVTVP